MCGRRADGLASGERLLVRRFVFPDAAADPAFLAIEPSLFGFRQVSVVLCHISLFPVLQVVLALLQICSLLRRKRPVFHAIGDPLLLPSFAPIHLVNPRMSGIDHARSRARSVAALSKGGTE